MDILRRSRIPEITREYQKDDLIRVQFGLRLPVSDPVLGI